MKQRKIISLPTNEDKIYRQILTILNFMLNLTPQERDILAELIKLNNEYEVLPPDKRGKFILSTDMRKELQILTNIKEKQFNTILTKLRKKLFMGKPLISDDNILHSELCFKPDADGFSLNVNLVMTILPKSTPSSITPTTTEVTTELPTPTIPSPTKISDVIVEEVEEFSLTPINND
jgi:hypothetical protein